MTIYILFGLYSSCPTGGRQILKVFTDLTDAKLAILDRDYWGFDAFDIIAITGTDITGAWLKVRDRDWEQYLY